MTHQTTTAKTDMPMQYLVVVFTNIRVAADVPAANGASLLCCCRCVFGNGGVHQRGGGCMLKRVATSQECYDQICLQIVDFFYNCTTAGEVTIVNDLKEFESAMDTNKDKLIVAYHTAAWCGPCKMIWPIVCLPPHLPSGPLLPPPPHPVQSHPYRCSMFWPPHLRVAFVYDKVLLSFPPPSILPA